MLKKCVDLCCWTHLNPTVHSQSTYPFFYANYFPFYTSVLWSKDYWANEAVERAEQPFFNVRS